MESDAGPIFHRGRTYFIKSLSLLIGSLRITPHALWGNVNVSKAVMGPVCPDNDHDSHQHCIEPRFMADWQVFQIR
jgi:hypothetical protein